jgi:GxxExxY protein
MSTDEHRLNGISERIIGCAYKVSHTLGYGFLEKVYENALAFELRESGLHVSQQQPVTVRYHGRVVGEYVADLLVEGLVLVELKCVTALDQAHVAQSLELSEGDRTAALSTAYLRARSYRNTPGYPLNFCICVHLCLSVPICGRT